MSSTMLIHYHNIIDLASHPKNHELLNDIELSAQNNTNTIHTERL